VNDYGCEDCGAVGWHRDGEKIFQVGEQDGAPVVQRVVTVSPIDEPMALPKHG
jgi:hypothetical protein